MKLLKKIGAFILSGIIVAAGVLGVKQDGGIAKAEGTYEEEIRGQVSSLAREIFENNDDEGLEVPDITAFRKAVDIIYDGIGTEDKSTMEFFDISLDEAKALMRSIRESFSKLYGSGTMSIGSFDYSDDEEDKVLVTIDFPDGGGAVRKMKEFDEAARKFLSSINDRMTPLEKLLSLHDQICMVVNYGFEEDGETPDMSTWSSYDCVVKHTAICQGYADGFNCILRRAGFLVGTSLCGELNHIWNIVKLGDEWYHIDTTWDDPAYRDVCFSSVLRHIFFMLSDKASIERHAEAGGVEEINIINMDDFGNEITCSDTRFDKGMFWEDALSSIYTETGDDPETSDDDRFVYIDGNRDYNIGDELCYRDGMDGEKHSIVTIGGGYASPLMRYLGRGYIITDGKHLYYIPNSGWKGFYGGIDGEDYFYTLPEDDRFVISGFLYEDGRTTLTLRDTEISPQQHGMFENKEYEIEYPNCPKLDVYRLLNEQSGEHFYSSDKSERDKLKAVFGWKDEGLAWSVDDEVSSAPVWRLFNQNTGEHLYTADEKEKIVLSENGFEYEGIAWYSDDQKRVPVYRLFNPLSFSRHFYTTNETERDMLSQYYGYSYEGIAWYAAK